MAAALCSSLALGFTAPPSAGLRAARSPAASVRMASIEELKEARKDGAVNDSFMKLRCTFAQTGQRCTEATN